MRLRRSRATASREMRAQAGWRGGSPYNVVHQIDTRSNIFLGTLCHRINAIKRFLIGCTTVARFGCISLAQGPGQAGTSTCAAFFGCWQWCCLECISKHSGLFCACLCRLSMPRVCVSRVLQQQGQPLNVPAAQMMCVCNSTQHCVFQSASKTATQETPCHAGPALRTAQRLGVALMFHSLHVQPWHPLT